MARNQPVGRHIPIGRLTEPVTFLTAEPVAVPVTGLTAENGLAAAVTADSHGLRSGDYATIAGAVPAAYNSRSVQVAVTSPTAFTYAVPPGLPPTATGEITVTFKTDSQGGHPARWQEFGRAFAAIEPLNAAERLIVSAVTATVNYRAVVHYRTGLKAKMKLAWLRYQEPEPRQLEIFGVYPHPEPSYSRRYLVIECGEVTG